MRVLILGASGYAGRAIAQQLGKDYEVYGTYHTQAQQYSVHNRMFQLELSDIDSTKAILDRIRPQIIISSLRGNFQLQLQAYNDVTDYLLENEVGKIIYISTANVFDAATENPHYEPDKTNSETDYGNFKIECERMLQDKLRDKCIIVRIPEIWGKNCPRILKLIEDTENNTPIVTYPNLYVNYTTTITGNVMQFCLHYGDGNEEKVRKAYDVLKTDAKILMPLAPCEYSSLMADFIDKYGIRWCLFV